jgi:hypothetical protein
MAMTNKSVRLSITGPNGTARNQELALESIIIGSGDAATVRIDDVRVSSLHALLKVSESEGVSVIDLNSGTGTRLGGRAVQEARVAPGDVVEVGTWRIRVQYENAAALRNTAPAQAPSLTRAAPHLLVETRRIGTGPIPVDPKTDQRPTAGEYALEVVMLWGATPLEASQHRPGEEIRISGGKGGHFQLASDLLPGDPFTLVRVREREAILHVPPTCEATVRSGYGAMASEQRVTGAVTLGLDDRAVVQVGQVRFLVRHVRPAVRLGTPVAEKLDPRFLAALAASILLFVGFLVWMRIAPPPRDGLHDDLLKNPGKYAHLVIKPIAPKQPSGVKEGAKAKDEEGKFGKKEEKKEQADPSKQGSPLVDAKKREADRKKVLASGLLGALGKLDGAASNILGPGGLGTGINQAFGGIKGGAGAGDARGVGGLGSRGSGPGGGGTALGIGGLGTKGGGRGAGGYGTIDLGGRGRDTVRVIPGQTTVLGGLSREEIDRVIQRHQNEIRFCYETELQKDPDLHGKVQLTWTIDPSGAVSETEVSQTTIGSAAVEGCISSRVRRWRFPEPRGGGQVIVTYPWVFKAAGGGEEG